VTILAGFVIGIIALAVLVSALVCVWAVILDHCAAEADRMAEALTPEPMDHICPHGLPAADCFFSHTQQSEGTGEPMVGIEMELGADGIARGELIGEPTPEERLP
jgi:hypothetical protein